MRITFAFLLALVLSAALAQTAPQSVYLPLAQRSAATAMPLPTLVPTPTPLPGPVRIILPPEVGEPEHVLGAFAVGCHPLNGNCYYFVVIKSPGDQDGILLRWRPGAAVTELVARIDQPDDFTGPIALGSGALIPAGMDVDLAFSACTNGAAYGTGCTAYRWRIVGVDVPYSGERIQGDTRAVVVVAE